MVPSAERRAPPRRSKPAPRSGSDMPCSATRQAIPAYLVATSMISAVGQAPFADGALVLRGAEKSDVGPRRRCL